MLTATVIDVLTYPEQEVLLPGHITPVVRGGTIELLWEVIDHEGVKHENVRRIQVTKARAMQGMIAMARAEEYI